MTTPTLPIPYGRQTIDADDIAAVVSVLNSDFLTCGPKVEEFERNLASYCGVRYAVAFSNGTAALHGAYFASGIGEGESFVTSPLTFAASANAGLYMGARPLFCDIDPSSYNIDTAKVWDVVTADAKVRVITPVSYAGNPVDLEELYRRAAGRGIVVIHDGAHAIGARVRGESFCKYADMTMVSFHPVKHVATGEGGAILTDSEVYYKRLMRFRTHGITKNPAELKESHGPWYYEMQELGYNYRITDIQCALGISQLGKLDESIKRRRELADIYRLELNLEWLTLPAVSENMEHAYHLFPVLVSKPEVRRHFFEYLHKNGIKVQVHYIPVHLMPYYKDNFGFKEGDYPAAENFYSREISLPMYPGLTDAQIYYVIEKIKGYDGI